MSYVEDKGFSSVFGNAADGIEFDSVLEADDEDEMIEAVTSLDETSDDNDDFHETTGENDKDPEDIEDELQGQPDSGDNDHTDSLDIDLAAEMAMLEADIDFAETTGENDKTPKDIEDELEGRPDDGCNRHTGTFDSVKGSDITTGNYRSAERDLNDLDPYIFLGEDGDFDGPDPGYDMEDYDGDEDFDGVDDDYDGQDDYDGDEDFDGVAEAGDDVDDMPMDYGDGDYDDLDESSTDDPDGEDDLISAADEDDGVMSQAEVEALVAAGGDDEIIDTL